MQGPLPQPTQPATAPIETPVRVRKRPVPSELTPRNLKNCRLDDLPASLRAAIEVMSIYWTRLGIGGLTGRHVHGWSPECNRGVQGMLRFVKQWQAGSLQLWFGPQLHSEQRCRQTLPVDCRQQNHSPEVMHPAGQPPPCWHVLHGKPIASQSGAGDQQSLQGPPPQPTQLVTEPSDTPVLVRKRPVPRDPTPRNLKNWRLDDLPASLRAASEVRSI